MLFLNIVICLFMPRKPRIEYEGVVYHVMGRGNRREEIYRDDTDRGLFLETLTEVCARTGWVIHAFVLMVSNDWLSGHIFCGHPNNIPHSINEVKGKKNKALNRLVKAIRIYSLAQG